MHTGRCDLTPVRLDPRLEGWAREQGWDNFRPFQRESFDLVLGSDCDFIISAATSAGKTEAALLPLLTLAAPRRTGVSVLCISPTKALINDQHDRNVGPASRVDVPIFAWHGDVHQSEKRRLSKVRRGVLFITPESLEGRLRDHAPSFKEWIFDLDAIVIDEFHEFSEGSRGAHVASLLARVDDLLGRHVRRIALSATIADPNFARRWLRPQDARSVKIVAGPDDPQPFRSRIRGFILPMVHNLPPDKTALRRRPRIALDQIAQSLFVRLNQGTHIVFAVSRDNVETLCTMLRRKCERARVQNWFFPHHGNMAKHTRHELEEQLRAGKEVTAVCTTTLGLGVDIGSVHSVEFIGAPNSLTMLRQFIGRSGRRQAPSFVAINVTEEPLASAVKMSDRLRVSTVRACGALNLLEKRFLEPPKDDGTTLSVVFQQILSIIMQRNGALFSELQNLIPSVAVFGGVSEKILRTMLTHMASPQGGILEETRDGRFILTEKGEKLIHSFDSYASFRTTDQWDVVEQNRKVGAISLANALKVGSAFTLEAGAWEVVHLDLRHYRASVVPAAAGAIPIFDPSLVPEVHEELAQEMRRVLGSNDIPPDLEVVAKQLLCEGRETYRAFHLVNEPLVSDGRQCHLFTWKGTRFNRVLVELLRAKGFICSSDEIAVTIAVADPALVRSALGEELPSLADLSNSVAAIFIGKYDRRLPEKLLRDYWRKRHEELEAPLIEFCRALATGKQIPSGH